MVAARARGLVAPWCQTLASVVRPSTIELRAAETSKAPPPAGGAFAFPPFASTNGATWGRVTCFSKSPDGACETASRPYARCLRGVVAW